MSCQRLRTLLPLLATSLIASAASAATLPGINIRWDHCFADGGVMNKTFACDTNVGSDLMVMSVQLDAAMQHVSGMEIRVSIKPVEPVLPEWWEFLNSGSCRTNGLTFNTIPITASANCPDWGVSQQSGGFAGYHVNEIGPGTAVAFPIAAVPQSALVTLDPGTEYVVGEFRLNRTNTVGTGACGGCGIPVCILFTSLNITSTEHTTGIIFTQGANGPQSQIIHWQNAQLTNLVNSCTGTFNCNTQFDCVLAAPTDARRSTWGSVKALYR